MPKTTNHCQEWACGIPQISRAAFHKYRVQHSTNIACGIPQIWRGIPQIWLGIPQIQARLSTNWPRAFLKFSAAYRKYGAAFHNFCATSRKFGKAFYKCIMRHPTTYRGIPQIQRVNQQIKRGILQLCPEFHTIWRGILNFALHSTNMRRIKSTLLDVMNLIL